MNSLRSQFYRLPSRPLTTVPTEVDIVRDLRQGNFERAVQRFCQRPHHQRSNALYESIIFACAQVPDAVAAQAALNAMPKPSPSAVHHVVTALCREHNVPAALDVLSQLPEWDIELDQRMVTVVTRATQRSPVCNTDNSIARLDRLTASQNLGRASFHPVSAADLFVEDGGDCEQFLKLIEDGLLVQRDSSQTRSDLRRIMSAEASLRAARGDVDTVMKLWKRMQKDTSLGNKVGVLAAAISAIIPAGEAAAPVALNLLMTWVHKFLYDERTGQGKPLYVENPSAIALFITSVTKSLAAAAKPAPVLALSAFDALWEMSLPKFRTSLPLAGAYFKVLQHAELSLEETKSRIDAIRETHIQLDEQGFSMALGAILRCGERVVEKLAAGKEWTNTMRNAGIPLTLHTYNLFAGQLRYCNDPEMVSSLLSDMTNSGVIPSPVTYGLCFDACVIPGDYLSPARKSALPVPVWERVLVAMQEHMKVSGVSHTPNSRLSLARAYAHLGVTERAFEEFAAYLSDMETVPVVNNDAMGELEDAYSQMIFNLAHCRECSSDGIEGSLEMYTKMRAVGLPFSDMAVDSALVASVRLRRGLEAIKIVTNCLDHEPSLKLSPSGLRHLLMAHGEICDRVAWLKTRSLIEKSLQEVPADEFSVLMRKLIIGFARRQHRDICSEIMRMAHVDVPDLEYVMRGREFLRFRSAQLAERESPGVGSLKSSKGESLKSRDLSHRKSIGTFGGGSVLPL
eukprot:GFKZ01013144.1.p1 GENE.GFKZ01013144.1~~GFKZ01013144.1.p1  ORF type:complete len:740 (-),score=98.77 GFKZ01013144.1:2064-4283(-)